MRTRLPAFGAVWSSGRGKSASLTKISLRPDYPPADNSGVVSHLNQDCLKSVCILSVCGLSGPQDTDRFENIIAHLVLKTGNFYLHLCYAN